MLTFELCLLYRYWLYFTLSFIKKKQYVFSHGADSGLLSRYLLLYIIVNYIIITVIITLFWGMRAELYCYIFFSFRKLWEVRASHKFPYRLWLSIVTSVLINYDIVLLAYGMILFTTLSTYILNVIFGMWRWIENRQGSLFLFMR